MNVAFVYRESQGRQAMKRAKVQCVKDFIAKLHAMKK